jgi:hypothetical protein
MNPNLLWGNEQMNEKHNSYAYCISFFLSLFKIQNDVYGSLVGSTKKKQKRGERDKWYAWEKKKGLKEERGKW